jgi:hypothetical protein
VVDPRLSPTARVVWEAGDALVVRLRWRPDHTDTDKEQFQVIGLRGDKIREMADYRALGEATRAAKRMAAGLAG